MLIQVKGSRENAIHALINTWLKIPNRWCLNCGHNFDERDVTSGAWPCCDQPFLSTNQLIFKHFIEDMKRTREDQRNKHGSTKDKAFRYLLRFPPGLYEFLNMAFNRMYGEDLFTKEYDQQWFAKKFDKYFAVPEEI